MKEYLPRTGYCLFVLFFFQSFLTPVWSQTPANDNCEDVTPTVLTNGTPVTFTGTTEGATVSTVEIKVIIYREYHSKIRFTKLKTKSVIL